MATLAAAMATTACFGVLSFGVLCSGVLAAAGSQDAEKYTAIRVGKLLVGNGEEMDDVTILCLDGKVEAVGKNVELPFPCEVVDASGMTAMPGFIHPHSRMGLLQFGRGGLNAHRLVKDEFLPADDAFEDALERGFTTLVLAPPGSSGFPGQALVVRTADLGKGFVLEDHSYVKTGMTRPGQDKRQLSQAFDNAKKEIEKVEKAKKDWDDKQKAAAEEAAKKKAEEEAKKQQEAPKDGGGGGGGKAAQDPPQPDKQGGAPAPEKPAEFVPPPINPALQPLVDLIQKKEGELLLVEIGGASTYLHLREAMLKVDVAHVLYLQQRDSRFAATDLYLVADQLAKNGETLILNPALTSIPFSIDRLNTPRIFSEAGVTIAFAPDGDSPTELEAIRYQVAELVEAGLPREKALGALNLGVAKALGLAERLGSVEKGKDANLVLLSGDPLDVQTRIEKVVVEGAVAWDRAKAEKDRR